MTGPDPHSRLRPPEPRAVVFMDLDDSIFQTPRKCGPGPLRPAALDREGRPSSFLNSRQVRLLELLSGGAVIIPTTARNLEAFRRVRLEFTQGAILNYGGLILGPDGRIDPDWQDRMRPLCAGAGPLLAEALARANRAVKERGLGCRARLISDQGLDFYVVVKNYTARPEELRLVREALAEFGSGQGARIYLNDNNLSFRPAFLDKAGAVAYFRRNRLRPEDRELPVIGLGDSLSDLEFMGACDYLMMPAGSQAAGRLKEGGA